MEKEKAKIMSRLNNVLLKLPEAVGKTANG